MIYCLNCGKPVENGQEFCPDCGAYIPWEFINERMEAPEPERVEVPVYRYEPQQQPQIQRGTPKNKWTAVLLCFFLGMFGAHRFYEGKIGTGILYLFTAGLFGIGYFVDLIILLCKPNPYYV